ncbi:DUF6884 domain-containing protein, partial [uncultured Acetobacterium sp.]|uniref:DUF6884 domain-containing protein n=1 Tax=uncultured Acetobacterium sp. TaxID=217139 RepID=UPI0025DFED95
MKLRRSVFGIIIVKQRVPKKLCMLFKYSYDYAKQIADQVYILSAQYGLLDENDNIVPYEQTLNGQPPALK